MTTPFVPQSRDGVDASVIIPTHQRVAAVLRALDRLTTQTVVPARFEVIVVVDGSRDGTAGRLAALEPPFRLIGHEQAQRGRAAACNAGLARASGGIVVFLDDDMEPEPGWLAGHLAAHEPSSIVRGVMGAAPCIREPDMPRVARHLADRFDRHLAKLARTGAPSFRDVYTGNFSIRRRVLDEIGGFDEAFAVYGNEDGELALRLAAAGVPIEFAAAAIARQHQDKTLEVAFADAVAKGRTAVLLARKHPRAAAELRFGRHASGRRRVVRQAVALADRVIPGLPVIVRAVTRVLERFDPPGLDRWYGGVLEYAYFRGVRLARATDAAWSGP